MKDLSMHVIDIAGNSVRAGATLIEVTLALRESPGILMLTINDNGKGMSHEMAAKATDPFVTTRITRKVGLGLPLLKMNAMQTGGGVTIDSSPGKGTKVEASFVVSHVDCVPQGDIPGAIALLMGGNPCIDIVFKITAEHDEFTINTLEIKKVLGEIAISHPAVIKTIREMVDVSLLTEFYLKYNINSCDLF